MPEPQSRPSSQTRKTTSARRKWSPPVAPPRPCAYCGKDHQPQLRSLAAGNGQFCSPRCAIRSRVQDLTGRRFGRLLVESFAGFDKRKAQWNCICDCGTRKIIATAFLLNPETGSKSCGCLQREAATETITRVCVTHGRSSTPEYRIYKGMKQRCTNPAEEHWHRYGGRGIKICQGWLGPGGFENFLADMGVRPSPVHSIDRIDNDGHYSCGHCPECLANGWPANCRWATQSEQTRNKSDNRRLTLNGETRCIAEWSEITGYPFSVISKRINQGWTDERALTQPIRQTRRKRKSLDPASPFLAEKPPHVIDGADSAKTSPDR